MNYHFLTTIGCLLAVTVFPALAATPAPGSDSGMLPAADDPFKLH